MESETEIKGQHTPGPWSEYWVRPNLEQGHTFDPTCSILGYDPVFGRVRLADIPDPIDETAQANARLIAAAPDLLDACGFALSRLLGSIQEEETRRVLQAVISKATGK